MHYKPSLRAPRGGKEWPPAYRALYENPWGAIAYELTLHRDKPYEDVVTRLVTNHGAMHYSRNADCLYAWVSLYRTLRLIRYIKPTTTVEFGVLATIEKWLMELDSHIGTNWYMDHKEFPRWCMARKPPYCMAAVFLFDIYANIQSTPLWFHTEVYNMLRSRKAELLNGDADASFMELHAIASFVNACPFLGEQIDVEFQRPYYNFIPVE